MMIFHFKGVSLRISLYLDNIKKNSLIDLNSYLATVFKEYDLNNLKNNSLLTISVFTDDTLNLEDFSIISKAVCNCLPLNYSPKSVLLNNLRSPKVLIDLTREIFEVDNENKD